MDAETSRTIATSAITAISTLGAAAIVAYFGYRAQKKHTRKTDQLEDEIEQRKHEPVTAYHQASAYYQLEQKYSGQLASMTGQAQKTIRSQFRDAVQDETFDRPEWTTRDCEIAIAELPS